MTYRSAFLTTLLAGLLIVAAGARAQGAAATDPAPLAAFERLIGGRWQLGNSYQELEWGVGGRSVKARSYFVVEGEARLVSEGTWYWHPGEQAIKGVFTAVDMPVVLFDYTTRFDDDSMQSDLVAYAADGSQTVYTETWRFIDDTHFEWTLYATTPDGPRREMGGIYAREQ